MACTPNCGWCGRCTSAWERPTAACVDCGDEATTTAKYYTGPDTWIDEPVCLTCWTTRDNYEPPDADGEDFRGGEAAAFERESQIAAQRLK